MIKLLTKEEYDFFKELRALIIKYNVYISTDEDRKIYITLCKGDTPFDNIEQTSTFFQNEFDDSEIENLLDETLGLINQLNSDYHSELWKKNNKK